MDEKPKKKKSDKVAQIERLIELGRYDAADDMLKTMGFHPDTPRLMQALHEARPKREDPVMERTARRNRRFMWQAGILLLVGVVTGVLFRSIELAIAMMVFGGLIVTWQGIFGFRDDDDEERSIYENYQRPGYSSKKRRR